MAGREVEPPGQRWVFNGGATALLGRLIARGTGQTLQDYARSVLFDPLGTGGTEWLRDERGAPFAASGLRMTPRDLARIGVMAVQGGQWEGRRIVPVDWSRHASPRLSLCRTDGIMATDGNDDGAEHRHPPMVILRDVLLPALAA